VTPLDIEYTPAERDQALQDGISFAEKLNTSQGASRFRVMVLTAALMRSVQLPSRLRHCGRCSAESSRTAMFAIIPQEPRDARS
jgi:hypothetical protein